MTAPRRGVAVLLGHSALMSAGFFMLIPLLSVHLTQTLAFSGAAAGAVLALRQLTQQGLMVFGGALADRVGYRAIIALGMLVRALGFFAFAFAADLPSIVLAAVVTGLGGSLFEATGKAALASLVPPAERPRVFSLSAVAGGLGATVGPLIGVAFLRFSFASVGLAAGAFFFVAFLTAFLLPTMRGAGTSTPPLQHTLHAVARDRPFLLFTLLLTAFWALYNQVYISVPLLAVRLTGGADAVGLLYAVNAAAGLVLQYPLIQWTARRVSPIALVGAGIAVMALGLGVLSLAAVFLTPLVVMAAGIVIFAAGRSLAEPTKDTVTSTMAPPDQLAAYFGVSFLGLAVGGSAGNYAGGWLSDVGAAMGLLSLPFLVFLVFGATAGFLTLAAAPYLGARSATRPDPRPAPAS